MCSSIVNLPATTRPSRLASSLIAGQCSKPRGALWISRRRLNDRAGFCNGRYDALPPMRISRAALAFIVGLALSCAPDGPKFAVNYAPGFVKDGLNISVFGVFRDGRVNPEAWDE